ncbi:uncharacterized protein LOC129592765 [Paramacrobiotus metropolitanus]|uniref:uncharacterized protein LOC129592765 n=1 Tax=Paramacrobiotus metropolitanus TaxID=2943436 RepID=UPI0024457550|nr:uncharacterized protein LOC129592765 [Paramacrobiotus metropolitanus]
MSGNLKLCLFAAAIWVFLALSGAEGRRIEIVNRCRETIWIGSQGNPLPFGGGFELGAGQTSVQNIAGNTNAGRIWARTGCQWNNGRFVCQTGDCGAPPNNFGVQCGGIGGQPPASLAEFTFQEGHNQNDFYDLSNVDGYNIGIKMEPIGRSADANDQYRCGAPSCTMDMSACPEELKMTKGGFTVCASICAAVHNNEQRARFQKLRQLYDNPDTRAQVCCACLCPPNTGECNCRNPNSKYCCSPYNLPSPLENGGKCRVEDWPRASNGKEYHRVFKDVCPQAYSWQFDDHKSTYQCAQPDYRITFCP